MAILTTSGRAALAAALIDRPFHFAWGRGESWWNAALPVQAMTFAGTPQTIQIPHVPVASIVLKTLDGAATYQQGLDYVWDGATGIVTRVPGGGLISGASVLVEAVAGRPDMASSATALVDEIARRVATSKLFVIPDPAGAIETADGQRWTQSADPTRYIYASVLYGFAEADEETIREVGIFIDTTTAAGVPADQPYLAPAEVQSPGRLLLLDRFAPIVRSAATRQGFAYTLSI